MKLQELRKLVSKLNKDDRIVGVYKMNKDQIIEALEKVRYRVDEENKRLIPTVEMKRKKIIKLTEEDMKKRPRTKKVEEKKKKVILKPPADLVKSIEPKRKMTKAERDARVEQIRQNQERRKAKK
mgnify:CR=1 FL=1